jgi:predicted permease
MTTNLLRLVMLRLRALLGRRSLEDDMQAEVRLHLDRATDRMIARGMPPEDARLAARREFGNVAVIQEEARDARGPRWGEALAGDVRFAFRYFGRHKATVTIIVAVLALGTGVNTMIFSIFQAEFLRPAPAVPYDAAHARVWAQQRATRAGRWEARGFTLPELARLAERRDVFEDVAAFTAHDVVLGGRDGTEARGVRAQFVTANYFATLRVPLVAGPGFVRQPREDAPAEMTAVLSHAMATLLFGDAPGAVGRSVVVNDVPLVVVGIAPPRFQGAMRNMDQRALWIPLSARAEIARVSPRWLEDSPALLAFARMAAGVRPEQATALARQVVANTLPDSAGRVGMSRTADVLPMHAAPPGTDRNETIMAITAMATIGALILVIAWMNVSSLMVAAAVGRRQEIAVRLSLGASRRRILRQLVTEATVLAVAGGAAGLTIAWWTLTWLAKTRIDSVDIAPDIGTFAFTLGLAVVTGIVFGLSPALHATRGAVAGATRDSGAGSTARSRLQRTFVAAQIALSQPLLVVLGTMLAGVIGGYRPHTPEMSRHVIAVRLRPLSPSGEPSRRSGAVDSLVPRIAEHPEVVGAAQDARGFDAGWIVAPDRRAENAADSLRTIVNVVGSAPGWFAAVDVPIVLGRDVSLADTAGEGPASLPVVIGSDLARALWGDASPIGRTVSPPQLRSLNEDSTTMTVVGVYDATRPLPGMTSSPGAGQGDDVFRVFTARGKQWRHDRILVRTRGPAESFVPELRRLIQRRAPSLPVLSALTLAQANADNYRDALRVSALAGAGGVLALLLASLGLYGVVSLAVQQRTREIGIRIAVGANPARVARMFLGSGVRLGVIALLLGLPLSIVGLRLVLAQGLLIGGQVNPVGIGLAIAAILLAVSSAATWVPSRRAARVDPVITLRAE